VPLLMGVAIFTLLTTWSRGRALMRQNMAEGSIPLEVFTKSAHASAARVPGTAIFMASTASGVPSALLHNIKHNKVLHERVVILTVQIEDVPYVDQVERSACKDFGNGFYRVSLRFGFLEETDVPATLKTVTMCGEPFDMMKTSFFLSRQTLIASDKPGMAIWREKLFAWMLRNAASAMEFFRLPTTAWWSWAASSRSDGLRPSRGRETLVRINGSIAVFGLGLELRGLFLGLVAGLVQRIGGLHASLVRLDTGLVGGGVGLVDRFVCRVADRFRALAGGCTHVRGGGSDIVPG
jgi:hypothetical protein